MASMAQGVKDDRACGTALSVFPWHHVIYRENCDRIYSRAYWMTDNEIAAESLSANTFLRAFADDGGGDAVEQIDRAFVTEVRQFQSLGALTLKPEGAPKNRSIRGRMKRLHLERAVVQLPPTEKLVFLMHDMEGYEHQRISRLLGIDDAESRLALHQARLHLRNLVDCMA
ncbi:MAG TPA: sigma factor-like helix-turn-helix DNA-binding protein [Candidatus Saccharimonadales bacterium]|jgi:RNA polymerase sigma-70 factor (ECF subfamily)|nr:sigma factor-like helix-turn-helix DNA-binding protein [Candidatus Saccharimonadales bacterium]